MKRIFFIMVLLALVVSIAVPATAQECMDELGCVVVADGDPIVIASMLTISGATATLGEDSEGGIEIALSDRDNELLGHEIEWIREDALCNTEGGQAAAQRVAANEEVVGVIGTNCSSAATGALPILSEAGMVLMSPSNTSTRLTTDDVDAGGVWEPGYYRTAHNDLFQGAVAAQFAYHELGSAKLATVHDGSSYADSLQEVMADVFSELGGEVVFQGAVNVGDTDMNAILTEIAAAGADIIYYPIFEPESNYFTQQARDVSGLEDVVLMGADASLADTFPENTGDAAIGVYLSGPAVSGEAYEEFLEKWDEVIGGVPPSGFHAHAYDATNILLDAIEEVAEEGDDGSLIIGRQALRDALDAVDGFEGLTGNLTCQTEAPFLGDCATGEALAMFQITQEEIDGAWPPSPIWSPAEMDE